MQEFNEEIHAALYFSGYRYVIVLNRGNYSTLKPIKDEAPAELVRAMRAKQYSLLAPQVICLSRGFELGFIAENFFEPTYHDYVVLRD